jgi:predicted nucleic acid-binding protein
LTPARWSPPPTATTRITAHPRRRSRRPHRLGWFRAWIAEVAYLLARDAGSSVEAEFLRSFKSGFLAIVSPTADDLTRAADLVEQYADLPLGATDACIVALAERLNITELVMLDQRHFNVVRPRHTQTLTLIP